ncbi:NUDIX hydrolase [Bacterioplanes sanyensis]|uniref:Phosphatase NudJ n=1 Tax=Bacterioplanes sanyensis TaxID=1249553 RepID=A0A222FL59_9GAMM|nr:NUDIX hydrolase [Bacterioplanes sanyensis]ASP39765.1 NUDIX hydrolase [Bacterioplanes sanyensis]
MSERWTPHATVATLVEHQGRFLMVEEISAGEAVFNQPAGHVEANETLIEAACRETLEETGWRVRPTALLGLYTYTSPSNGVTYHRYCFIAEGIEAVAGAELDEGIIGPRWMDIDELRQCQRLRSPMVLTCVEDYLAGKRFPLDIIVEHP